MALLTAREAAKRLNRDERTIRRWVEAGKLTPKHSTSNRLAFEEQDIERLAQQLTKEDLEKRQVILDLETHVKSLEEMIQAQGEHLETLETEQQRILARLALIENATNKTSPSETHLTVERSRPSRQRSPAAPLDTSDLPAGTRTATEFARAHGVDRVTFRDHMLTGIRGDHVDHIARPVPNKPRETMRFLMPEQQERAVAFWERHGTNWNRCTDEHCYICGTLPRSDISTEDSV